MSKKAKSLFCVLLSLCMVLSVCLPGFAAVSYPSGVTNESAQKAAEGTDKLIENAAVSFKGKSLRSLVLPELFSDETLSALLTGIYSKLEESGKSLSRLGIDITPAGVANGLANYPSVAKTLKNASSWSGLDLSAASWGVGDKYDFSAAVSAMLSPFNDVLYTVLCSGSYKAGLFTFKGSNGYETGLVAMLCALGCSWYEEPATFYAEAAENRAMMIYNIALSLFSLLEDVLDAPAVKLSDTLPNLAHYIKDGGLEYSVNELLKPFSLHIGNIVSLFSGSQMLSLLMFLQDNQKYTTNFSENINTVLADMTANSGLKLAEIDLDTLKSCGTEKDGYIEADIGASFTTLSRWLIDTAKLNEDKLTETLSQEKDMKDYLPAVKNLLKKDTDELFSMLVSLLTAKKGTELDYEWTQKEFTATSVSYTENLGQEKYQRVLDGIDDVINEFLVEFGDGKSLKSTLKSTVYSGTTLAALAKGLYGQLDDEKTKEAVSALGISVSPYGVSRALRNRGFSSAANYLSACSKWSNVKESSLAACFDIGKRDGFEKALVAMLSPLESVFEVFFANGTLKVLDSVNIPGTNGYNTAVIPLLEALGCPKKNILTYKEYVKCKGSDKIISAVTTPVLDLVDKICKKPVYTLCEILPNAIYFISNGSLSQCLENLLSSVTKLLDSAGLKLSDLGLDIDKLKKTDILAEVSKKLPEMAKDSLVLPEPDLKSLAGIGTLTEVQSKRTYSGSAARVYAVESDKTAVLITLLRYFVGAVKDPKNSDTLNNMMAPKEGQENNMFAQYSSGIGDQMNSMSVDEAIEWLYKLFFRERAVEEITGEYVYDKEIIYHEEETTDKKNVLIPILIVLAVLAVIAVIKRNQLRDYFDERSRKRAEKKAQRQKELDAAVEKFMAERDAKAAEKAAADSKKEPENEANREA